MTTTVVHLLRHGEVYNPQGILYGRAAGFVLSDRGLAMAERVAERIGDRDITRIVSSPLERAQQTAAPLAKARGLVPVLDERVIESTNVFEGRPFTIGGSLFRQPSVWRHLVNPFKPSWGEPYAEVAARTIGLCRDRGHAALHPWDRGVDLALVELAHAAGVAVNTWTVDDSGRIVQLADWGVDGIVTNVPDIALRTLGRRTP